mgnify:CR=1 FL=1
MDISSIAAMIDLEYLNLERAKVDSLEYLERCKKLEEVYINTENGPFSFAILGSFEKVEKTDIWPECVYSIFRIFPTWKILKNWIYLQI